MRLFLGVELPDGLHDALDELQSKLRRTGAAVRWVDPSSAHFTLKFLGETPPREVPDIEAAAARAARRSAPARLRLVGLGAFPSQRQPRVVWVGLEGDVDRVRHLHDELEEALKGVGFAPDRRCYRPHVTLGRVKDDDGLDALREAMAELREAEIGELAVRRFALIESRLSPEGARYRALDTWRLTGPGPG